MSKEILMQFVGFESKPLGRQYVFTVREGSAEPREFTVTVSLAAFSEGRIRFQDAPDLCARRLRRELASNENHPLESHFQITETELEDYHNARTPVRKSPFGRRPPEDY